VTYAEAKELAERALCLSTAADVRRFVEEKIASRFPQITLP
jgi:hypothetical protein